LEQPPKIQSMLTFLKYALAVVVIIFISVFAWKLANAQFNINLGDLRFPDLLALILALFAIALSASFYFKATDTSSEFYNNTFKFTKEISEILGRIEERFGERLRHLDEAQISLGDKFDRLPIDRIKVEEDIEKEKGEVKKWEEERQDLLEKLAERAKLQDSEKQQIFTNLEEKEKQLRDARRELSLMRDHLAHMNDKEGRLFPEEPLQLTAYLRRWLKRLLPRMYLELLDGPPDDSKIRRISRKIGRLSDDILYDMRKQGLLDNDNNVTQSGYYYLQKIKKSYIDSE